MREKSSLELLGQEAEKGWVQFL